MALLYQHLRVDKSDSLQSQLQRLADLGLYLGAQLTKAVTGPATSLSCGQRGSGRRISGHLSPPAGRRVFCIYWLNFCLPAHLGSDSATCYFCDLARPPDLGLGFLIYTMGTHIYNLPALQGFQEDEGVLKGSVAIGDKWNPVITHDIIANLDIIFKQRFPSLRQWSFANWPSS